MLLLTRMSVEEEDQLLLDDLLGSLIVNSWDTAFDLHFCFVKGWNKLENFKIK